MYRSEDVVNLVRKAYQHTPPRMATCVDAVNALVECGVLLDDEDTDGLEVDLARLHELVKALPQRDQTMISEFIGGTQLLNQSGVLN